VVSIIKLCVCYLIARYQNIRHETKGRINGL
jgi:hypothetical protein